MAEFAAVRPPLRPLLFPVLPSTNAKLWELAAAGVPAGTVVLAGTQTAGRGQRGRTWQSGPGGLYLSLLLQPEVPSTHALGLTLASAWGIASSLRCLGVPVQVKWPNDLVLEGKKLGGILSETRIAHGTIHDVVVGVGLNWSNAVPPTGVALSQRNLPPPLDSLETLAAVVLYGVLQGHWFWQGHGSPALWHAYDGIMTHRGQTTQVGTQTVRVLGLGSRGNLRVQQLGGDGSQGKNTLEVAPGAVTLGYNA